MGETYVCAACGGIYEKTRTDKEAMGEAVELFGEREDLEIVCDDCFQEDGRRVSGRLFAEVK